jgi:hypothetical protein
MWYISYVCVVFVETESIERDNHTYLLGLILVFECLLQIYLSSINSYLYPGRPPNLVSSSIGLEMHLSERDVHAGSADFIL